MRIRDAWANKCWRCLIDPGHWVEQALIDQGFEIKRVKDKFPMTRADLEKLRDEWARGGADETTD